MDEIFREVTAKVRGMWAHRKLGLAVAWLVGLAALVTISILPDKYEASARIFVNTDSILKPLMTGLTVQPNEELRIIMLSRVVISRPNVEKLVQTVGLDEGAKNQGERDFIVDRTLKTLEFKSAGRENIYRLSFRNEDPQLALKAIDMLASMFIESSKGGKTADTEAAKRFIDEQVGVYEHKLQEAENRLKDFRVKYLGMTPGDGKDNYFARVSDVERLLNQARLELREAENARDAYRSRMKAETDSLASGAPSGMPSAATIEIDARIDASRRNIESLLQRYTEAHPDVVAAQRVLRELEAQKRNLASSPAAAPILTPRNLLALESLKVSLAQSEANVASLRIRVGEYTERYNRLKSSAALMPQLEAELAQLNRDYEVNKRNYESLVTRRESANISGEMQTVAGDFRLVDPPRVTPRPVSPNRRLFLPIALLLAIGAGIGAAYVASQVRPSYFDARALRDATALPVLGVVSLVRTEQSRIVQRRNAMRFVGLAGALVAAYVVGLVAFEIMLSRMA